MSAVDVLGVMAEAALYVRNINDRHALQGDVREARAVVAELIAAMEATIALSDFNLHTIYDGTRTAECQAMYDRCAAAVSAAKGGAA